MRRLPPSVASLVTLYEEITEAGDVTFEWPAVPPGTQATFELTQAPAESTATASLSGVLDGADLPGAYVLERTCSLMGHAVRKDVAVAFFEGDISAPLRLGAPAVLALAAGSTTGTLVSAEATGGTGPYTYAATVSYESTGTGVAFVSGVSGRNISLAFLSNGLYAEVTITATDSVGATTSVVAAVTVASVAAGTMLPGAAPATQTLDAGTTTASILFNDVTGAFTAPVTYVATVVSGSASVSNVGKAVSLTGAVNESVTLVRLRATDSTGGTPLVADAFALVVVRADTDNVLEWRPIYDFNLAAAENAAGPFAVGTTSVPLVDDVSGNTIACEAIYSLASGNFALQTSTITVGEGWKTHFNVSSASASNIRGPLKIPLPFPIGNDDDIRITIWGKANQPVSGNSFYWQVCYDKGGATPTEDDADCWGGIRLLKSGAATALMLKHQSGGGPATISNTSTPPCPLAWLDGSTEVRLELYLPRYTNRARINMSGTGSVIAADLGSATVTASRNALRGGWVAGDRNIWLLHTASNGAANGLGAQVSVIRRILIERRTLP